MKRLFIFIILTAVLVAGSGALTRIIVKAQEPGGTVVTITGTLTGTSADGGIIVDGTTYHLASGVTLPSGVLVGTKITITGTVSNSTQIIITVIRLAEPTPAPATTSVATPAVTAAATESGGFNVPG